MMVAITLKFSFLRVNSINTVLQSLAPLINSNENVVKLEAIISKLLDIGAVINTSAIRSQYLNGITWNDDNFQLIDEWFSRGEQTTTEGTTVPTQPTTQPTLPPTQPTVPTTEPPSDNSSNSIVLSFALLFAGLLVNFRVG